MTDNGHKGIRMVVGLTTLPKMMRNVNNRFEILEEIPLNLALIEANRSFFTF